MGDRRLAWFAMLCLQLVLLSPAAAPVRAQTTQRPSTDAQAGPQRPAAGQPAPPVDDDFEVPGLPPATQQEDPEDAVNDGSQTDDGDDAVPRIRQRPMPVDGDLDSQPAPVEPRDGIVEVGEPPPVEDGVDPTVVDTRDAEDIALFENPPAGFDPLLFQIEEIDPVRDNRATTRLFRLEPYDPVGVRIGSFVLFPELEIGGLWNSNVFRAPFARSDKAADLRPSARLVSNWSRHALEINGRGAFSFYDEFDTENDKSYTFETRGRLDVTRFTNLQGILSHDKLLESRSALNAIATGSRVPITTDRAEAALNHRFNRLRVQIRGSVTDNAFGDSDSLGVVSTNADRNYTQYEETVRGTWDFKPTLSGFTEVAVNQRNYDRVNSSDLISRTSDGQRYRAGVSFGNTGQILRGEIGLGYGVQTPDSDLLRAIDGLIIDANATWRMSDLTSVLFTARSDIAETTAASVGGALVRSAGVEVRHSLRRYLIASAGLTYTNQDSQDGLIDETEWRSNLGLEYYVSPEAILFGDYTHINFDAIGNTSDYDADEVRFGLRLRR